MSVWWVVLGALGFLLFAYIIGRLIYHLIRRLEDKDREKFEKRDY